MTWRLYYISLLPLFGYIVFKYYEPTSFSFLIDRNWSLLNYEDYAFFYSAFSCIVIFGMLLQLGLSTRLNYQISGAKITGEPELINHEMTGVLSSVVLPFLTVDFRSLAECGRSIFVIVLIGLIATRSKLYYKNPVLAIVNLKIYKVVTEHSNIADPKQFDVITFSKLKIDDSLYLKKIGDGVYYAKKINNG